ncbi:MAG: hypothetical protein HFE39_07615 [Clostridiales bacterium]|jgi:hypothetical protein|nr:hypothetical protein [Clostridiales bacterium]
MKKLLSAFTVALLIGALFTGCNNDRGADSSDGTVNSRTESMPSPGEVVSNIPSAVEGLVSDVESGVKDFGSALTSSASRP